MPKIIQVAFSPAGIQRAIKDIEEYAKTLNSKLDEICRRLAEECATEAASGFATAPESDVSVTYERYGNGYIVTAAGEKVCFIEFGTGVEATHPRGAEFGMVDDSWSSTHKQIYHNKGFWHYKKVKYTGTPAYMFMYTASKNMQKRLQTIADEVFDND